VSQLSFEPDTIKILLDPNYVNISDQLISLFMELKYLTPWSWALLETPPVNQYSRISQHFLKPEGSLLYSQEPPLVPILSHIILFH
jgi:hypothetical protein